MTSLLIWNFCLANLFQIVSVFYFLNFFYIQLSRDFRLYKRNVTLDCLKVCAAQMFIFVFLDYMKIQNLQFSLGPF